MSAPRKHSIRRQLMRLSVIIVTVSTVLSLGGTLFLTLHMEQQSLDGNLLNSASVLSRVPLVADTLRGDYSTTHLAQFLDDATAHVSDIDLIVVGDIRGVQYYAPNHEAVGTVYSSIPLQRIFAGESAFTTNDSGPLGSDHSAYAPVLDADGSLLGFVIVGVYMRSVTQVLTLTVLRYVGIALFSVLVGGLLALQLSRNIKSSLQGYEPDAFAQRLHQREDILEALEEGILAIDQDSNIIFFNAAAARMLPLSDPDTLGRPLHSVYPQSTLSRILRTGRPEYNVRLSSLKNMRVISDRLPIYEDGKLAGAVGIFRNRTEVTRLAEDLTGVRHMVDAMRAYTHEFMNKLHVIQGLLQIGEPEKAQQYIMDTTHTQQEVVHRIANQIKEPSVAALLVGKTSRAGELGIRLTLDRSSILAEDSPWLPPDAYVTVLGNLIENAIEGLNQTARGEKFIAVSIRDEAQGLLLCVEDTGPGIPADLRKKIFYRGASSKGETRGTGLALVQEIVDAYHGDIRVESEVGVGTSFFISFRQKPISP